MISKYQVYIKNDKFEECLTQLKFFKNNYDIDRIYYYGNYNSYMNYIYQNHYLFCHYIFDKKNKKNQIHFINNTKIISIG